MSSRGFTPDEYRLVVRVCYRLLAPVGLLTHPDDRAEVRALRDAAQRFASEPPARLPDLDGGSSARMLSTTEAAVVFECTPKTIRKYCRLGLFVPPAQRIGGRWAVPPDASLGDRGGAAVRESSAPGRAASGA